MRLVDLIRLAIANLRRSLTRTTMTTVGVMIGVAALVTLMSYGAGLQRTARKEFNALQLYNTLRVTSRPSMFAGFGDFSLRGRAPSEPDSLPEVALTDSLIESISRVPGVLAAYPEIVFPVQVESGGRRIEAGAEAVPMVFAGLDAYRIAAGSFFRSEADSAVLLSASMARRLGYEENPERLVGDTVTVSTATLDLVRLRIALSGLPFSMGMLPIRTVEHRLVVRGLLEEDETRLSGVFRLLVPLELAMGMQKLSFFSTFDLMMRRSTRDDGYGAVLIQLQDMDAHAPVVQAVEGKGVYVTSFREQFRQLDRLFVVYDLALGVIGFIALVVATVGMANTMMMNVMERYREIGIMKAIGGEEADLQRLFLVESALIGLAGSAAGIVFGWGVTRLINSVANIYLNRLGIGFLDLFHFPPLLVGGIILLTLFVAVLAGFAPARRAARVEPLDALRHL
jgi:putative ABC transport system permease protein